MTAQTRFGQKTIISFFFVCFVLFFRGFLVIFLELSMRYQALLYSSMLFAKQRKSRLVTLTIM